MNRVFCLILVMLLPFGCARRPAITQIEKLSDNLSYERLNDVNGGVRVISCDHPKYESDWIVIPGDVVWCESVNGFIIGEKRSSSAPAEWMDKPAWNRVGFFLLNPSLLNPSAIGDERFFGNAITWYSTREELTIALERASHTSAEATGEG